MAGEVESLCDTEEKQNGEGASPCHMNPLFIYLKKTSPLCLLFTPRMVLEGAESSMVRSTQSFIYIQCSRTDATSGPEFQSIPPPPFL